MPWVILAVVGVVFLYAWAASRSLVEDDFDMSSSLTQKIAEAIALAEGFFHPSGTAVPQRANNPGNLKAGDVGLGLIGGKTIYATIADGWAALERQINYILTGTSRYYTPDMTLREVAEIYTGHDNAQAWANIVAGKLGVTPETKIGEVG